MKKLISTTALTICLLGVSGSFAADAKSFSDNPWQLRLRAINVDPDEESTTSIGADVDAKSAIVPEFDITYFVTKNIAAELILATANHDMYTNTGLDLGDVWILPPTLTLQYHFMPEEKIRPYVGAGINYTFFYDANKSTSINRIEYDDTFGYALQAGADFMIDDHWGINLDVKKVYLPVDVSINGGSITADVDLDPWVFGTGITYKF